MADPEQDPGNRRRHAALVTGGSRGIGRVIALTLARAGHPVALTYHRERDLAETVVSEIQDAGGQAVAISLEQSSRDQVQRAVNAAAQDLHPVTVLVNNAAMAQEKPFQDLLDADWDRMMAVNLRGPFALIQETLPAMIAAGFGRIINITSVGGQWGGLNQVHYAAAKAALINLTRSIARIHSRAGVTANAVSPGLVSTDMTERELDSDQGRDKVRQIPAGRIGTAAEVANTVAFLAGDAASYITGQTINVNGGMYFG